jgi:hypothetical protein
VESNYYVYIYLDIRKPNKFTYNNIQLDYEPFYIGKGKGKRFSVHLREAFNWEKITSKNALKINKIKAIKNASGKNPEIIKIENLNKQEALNLEIELIKFFGRIDNKTGILTNMTEGGESGNPMKGKKHREDTKIKMSQSGKDKIFTKEHREALSKSAQKESRNEKFRNRFISNNEHLNRSLARKENIRAIKKDKQKYDLWCNNLSKSHVNINETKEHKSKRERRRNRKIIRRERKHGK